MRAAGAAILGAAFVGAAVLVASSATAADDTASGDSDVDFDVDAEVQLATNYFGMALANPVDWSDGQLKSLEGLLMELGFQSEAQQIADMRVGLYGDTMVPPAPLPDIQWIPQEVIDEIANRTEEDLNANA